MQPFRKSRFLSQLLLPLVLIGFLPACHQWVPLTSALAHTDSRGLPSGIQIMGPHGMRTPSNRPALGGVSFGAVETAREATTRVEYFDIASLESHNPDPAVPAAALVLGAVAAGGMGLAFLSVTIEESLRY
jgi:hypothetical protein